MSIFKNYKRLSKLILLAGEGHCGAWQVRVPVFFFFFFFFTRSHRDGL